MTYVPPAEPILDLADIQGNILNGFNKPYQALIGVRIPRHGTAAAKTWLLGLLPLVNTSSVEHTRAAKVRVHHALANGQPKPRLRDRFLNVAFSSRGLEQLTSDVREFSQAFIDGQWRRSSILGDPSDVGQLGCPASWNVGGDDETTPDVLLVCAADRRDDRNRLRNLLIAGARAAGMDPFWFEDGNRLAGGGGIAGREHFGFKDGIARVRMRGRKPDGTPYEPRDPRARQDATLPEFCRPGEPLVWPGQVLLGYPRQSATDTRAPLPPLAAGPAWAKGGSYLVFRRLRQDVPAFRDFVRAETARMLRHEPGSEMTEERFGAMIVGRWPNGVPLEASPRSPHMPKRPKNRSLNDFQYLRPDWPRNGSTSADISGERCPLSAHIRKVNPRDQASDLGPSADNLRRTILRRGIPYGRPLSPGATDTADRGLLFLSFQASIEDTFETIIQDWVNTTAGPTPGSGYDMMLGRAPQDGERFCTFGPHRVATSTPFVYATGGGYFFAPSISAIRDVLAAPTP